MELANPYFIENIYQDQPYSSMLLIAPHCDFTCEGCQNKHLKNDFKDIELNFLVEEYNKNPFFEGITVGGLEIFLSGEDFKDELISLIKKTKSKNLTIYTRFEKYDKVVFEYIEKLKQIDTLKNIYLKTGKYMLEHKKKKIKIKNFEITLGSSNQTFEKIK